MTHLHLANKELIYNFGLTKIIIVYTPNPRSWLSEHTLEDLGGVDWLILFFVEGPRNIPEHHLLFRTFSIYTGYFNYY